VTKVSDYVWNHLADRGVRQVFVVTGGGAMHLNDSLGQCRRIQYICNHHEQACAMAAEGYARAGGGIGVINVTTGPGGINAINGVFGAWTDSIPMLVVSGQVKRETCLGCNPVPGLRQLGDQEADLVGMVKGITKYAVLVTEPESIAYHLDKALHLATSGRGGPCWIDIPVDVQAARIDESRLRPYDPEPDRPRWDLAHVSAQCREIVSRLQKAARPVVLVGTGLRLAGAMDSFERVIRLLGVPVTTAWTAHDLMDSEDPLYAGRPGTLGDRAGNFAVQNSDLLLVIGCRLNIRQVSYNWPSFARHAFKIQVDVDPAEFQKPTVRPDMAVLCDAGVFLEELGRQLAPVGDPLRHGGSSTWRADAGRHAAWLAWCKERVARYPVLQPGHQRPDRPLNPYHFVHELFNRLGPDDVVVCGDGTACVVPFQAGRIRKGLRMFTNSGAASMGYDLPAAIGAAVAREGRRVICLAGDGSVQMNLQELQTVAHHRWPIKLFVLNNGGYLSIRTTQQNFFGRVVGESPASGVSFPDPVRIAQAYGLAARRIDRQECGPALDEVLSLPGPVVTEVVLDPKQEFEPRLSSRTLPDGRIVSAALEDMYPFLDREELQSNMIAPIIPHEKP